MIKLCHDGLDVLLRPGVLNPSAAAAALSVYAWHTARVRELRQSCAFLLTDNARVTRSGGNPPLGPWLGKGRRLNDKI